MADWQRRLNLTDVWASKDIPLIARAISDRLRQLSPLPNGDVDYERTELADKFADIASEPAATADEFDSVMEELYDWGDTALDDNYPHCQKKVCWVATSF